MASETETQKTPGTLWPTLKPYAYIAAGFFVFLSLSGLWVMLEDVRGGRLGALLDVPGMLAASAGMAVAGAAGIGGLVVLAKFFGGRSGDDGSWYHGTARFATDAELRDLTLPPRTHLPPGSFYLAPAPDGSVVLPRSETKMHGAIIGGTGRGKSRAYSLPNAAWARETSLVLFDPKYELWRYTSGLQPNPRRYAPTDPGGSECFNWIPLCTNARLTKMLARALVESGNVGNTDQFWLDGERAFLSALFAHAATLAEPTPLTAYHLFTRQRAEQLKEQLLNSPSSLARAQALIFYEQTDAKVRGGVVPALANRLDFLEDEAVARFTSASLRAPDFGELRRRPTAVYYSLREQDIAMLQPLTSVFFTLLLEQLAAEEVPDGREGVPITMILDEFANLGVIPDFARTITLARGRDVAVWIYLQALSQLSANYGRENAATILAQCNTKVALHGLDPDTAEYVSRMLGDRTVVVDRRSYNDGGGLPAVFGGGHGSTTYSQTDHKRPLLTPDEVMRIGENEALVRTGNRYPMRLWKIYYDEPLMTAQARELGPARVMSVAPAPPAPQESEAAPAPLPPDLS